MAQRWADALSATFSYPVQFAESVYNNFEGNLRQLINDANSTFTDLLACDEQKKSVTGYQFTPEEIQARWEMIVTHKRAIQAAFEKNC